MRVKRSTHVFTFVLGTCLVFAPSPAWPKVVDLQIRVQSGYVDGCNRADVRLQNAGDSPLARIAVTATFPLQKAQSAALARLEPAAHTSLSFSACYASQAAPNPGIYPLIVEATFEDEDAFPYSTLKALPLRVGADAEQPAPVIEIIGVEIGAHSLVKLKNHSARSQVISLRVLASAEFDPPLPARGISLAPGEQREITFPLSARVPHLEGVYPFVAVAEYLDRGRHQTAMWCASFEPPVSFWDDDSPHRQVGIVIALIVLLGGALVAAEHSRFFEPQACPGKAAQYAADVPREQSYGRFN